MKSWIAGLAAGLLAFEPAFAISDETAGPSCPGDDLSVPYRTFLAMGPDWREKAAAGSPEDQYELGKLFHAFGIMN